jgi:hypothetical protein
VKLCNEKLGKVLIIALFSDDPFVVPNPVGSRVRRLGVTRRVPEKSLVAKMVDDKIALRIVLE